jgi:hypothetical protein
MPFESLSCQNCGSTDLQEVKPGTYFCNHCESVFKYVRPNQTRSTGGCDVLVGGSPCGIPATGRCRTCQRAFCGTHVARVGKGSDDQLVSESAYGVGSAYPDWCARCRAIELRRSRDPDAGSPALGQPFGIFIESHFLTGERKTSGNDAVPEEKALDGLIGEADRALEEYSAESSSPLLASQLELYQFPGDYVVDRTALAAEVRERITRFKKSDGSLIYIYDMPIHGGRFSGAYFSIWTPGRSRMLVARYSHFPAVHYPGDDGVIPELIRYSGVEEVGAFRMEAIAGSLKRHFSAQIPPEKKLSKESASKWHWFR